MDPNTCWAAGHINNALQFDGMNDYVQIIGYKGILGSHARTCTAWIKTPGAATNTVILNWGPSVFGQQWIMGLFSTGEFAIYTGGPYSKTTMLVNDNQWHHVAAVLVDDGSPDISEIKLYVDGQLRSAVNSPGAINTALSNDMLIGAFFSGSTPSGFFNGLIDDVQIYSYALSNAEIAVLAQ
jgi:hypothetical protein